MIQTNRDNEITEKEGTIPVLLFYDNLMFGVQLQNMARQAGQRHVTVKPGLPLPEGLMLVVDIDARSDWEAAIREATQKGIPVVAFGPHTNVEARKGAKEAGASRVLANGNLTRDLPAILRSLGDGRE
jgi:hypothetical protein